MTINHRQSDSFADCCNAFKKLTDNYVLLKDGTESFFFFRTKSAIDTIIDSINGLIEKIECSSVFAKISREKELFFVERCGEIYIGLKKIIISRLKNNNRIDTSLVEFSNQFFGLLKKSLFCLWRGEFQQKNEINLNYMGYYLDAISVGLDCPTNYLILKETALNVIFYYISSYPKSTLLPLVNSVFESIQKDDRGINQHEENHENRFYNILKLLEMFRLTLTDQQESTLSSSITQVIDNALEITRPNTIKTFSSWGTSRNPGP